jgi:SAM-dependent methyltransferase
VAPRRPSLDEIQAFWEANPVADSEIRSRDSLYDYLREFDNLRESPDVEPYAFSNLVHDYEGSAGKTVLDYGCGNGYVLAHYARNGATVFGVDLTEAAIDLTRARFDLVGLEGTFVQGDGTSIPFEDGTFDVACAMGVLHHIPDPAPVVAELHRVLKPGGKLVVMLYNRDSFRFRVLFRFRSRRGRLPVEEVVKHNDGAGNPWGTVYSEEEAGRLLGAFVDHRFLVNKLPPGELALWWSPLERLLVRLLPRRLFDALARRYGWNLYCIARKPPASQ